MLKNCQKGEFSLLYFGFVARANAAEKEAIFFHFIYLFERALITSLGA